MGKYNSGKNEYVKKHDPKSLAVEIVAILAIAVLVVAMVMIGANKGGSTTSIFAVERKTYILDADYRVSDLDFNAIGSTENNLKLTKECIIDLNGFEFDLNGYALTIVPTYSGGIIGIKNGTVKNGTLIIDSDENDVLIENVVFDKTLRYTLNCSGSRMTIISSTVISRNLKVAGGTLFLDNAKMDNYSLTSDFIAKESTIGTLTTAMDDITITATNCAINGISIRSNNVTLAGDINCEVEVSNGATASADSNEIIDVKVKDKVSILNVNADANVTLLRDGFTEYGATVDALNVYYEGAVINAENCSTIGVLSSYVNARLNLSGVVKELNLLAESTVIVSRAAIVEKMLVREDATIDFSGSVYKATFAGDANATFNASSYILDLEVLDDSTATIALNCSNGGVARIYNNMSKIAVQRDCKMMVIDYTNGTAQISNDSAVETVFEENISDDEIKSAINDLMIPILYVDSSCDAGGRYVLAPGANKNSTKLNAQSLSSSGHIYDRQIIKQATENEDGLELQVCKLCGVSHEVVINRKKILYAPNTIADYLGLLLDAGEYDYSLDENSGYVLNKVGGEDGSSSAEYGTTPIYDLLIFNKCYAHLSVEKIKDDNEISTTGTMRLFGDVEVDALVLKGYAGNIDEPIDESKAQEVAHHQFTGAFKDSILAFTYYGPGFVFLKEGEHLINFGALADFLLLTMDESPEDFDSQDLISLIETVRRAGYYFERYGTTFKFVVQALLNKIDLSSVTPGLSFFAQDETVENRYYLSFQHLKDQLTGTKGQSLNTYLDDIFGKGTVTDLLRYAYNLPDERIEDIYSTLCYLAGNIAGMSEDALIDNFNILLEILLNDALDNLPGDIPTIKNNIKQYFGVSFDIRNAIQDYGKKTVYELIYGEYIEDPQSENPQADYEQYAQNKREFDAYWRNTIGSIDNTVLNSSMDAIVTGLLESFDLYTGVGTFDVLLDKVVELDKYIDYAWYDDGTGNKLTSELTVYVPDNIDEIIQSSTGSASGVLQKVMTFLSQHVPFFANLGAGSTADEGEVELIEIFNCTYDNQGKYFIDMLFDWQYVDQARFIVTVTGTDLVETPFGSFYTNSFNVNITKPMDDADDLVLLNFDFDEKTMSISNLEANYVISEDTYIIYHNYNSYIEGGVAIGKLSNALLSLRLNYKEGHLASDAFVIGDDATPTSVVKDKLNLFDSIKVNLTVKDLFEIPEIELFALTFAPQMLFDGKQYVSLTTFMPIEECMEYRLLFDDDEFYIEGYTAIMNLVNQRYRFVNDEFLRNDEGQIRGMKLIVIEDWFESAGDIYYETNEYKASGGEVYFGNPIHFKFVGYGDVATNISYLWLNDEGGYMNNIYVMDDDEVYVGSLELNPDFNPAETDKNFWLTKVNRIGNINDDPSIVYNEEFVVEGTLAFSLQDLAATKVSFTTKDHVWAHYTTQDGDDYQVKSFEDWDKDIVGELTPYKLTYYRYDEDVSKYADVAYLGWTIDGDTAVFDQYIQEGGSIVYDIEKDEVSGNIYEYVYDPDPYSGNNYVSRLKYYVEDEKLAGERKIYFLRNRYEGYTDELIKTDMYLTLDIVAGDKQDAYNIILGSDWLYMAEMVLYSKNVINSCRSYEEIAALNSTELYQILMFKDYDSSYCGVDVKLYDYEVAFEASFDEFMFKLDTRRFSLPLVIDILINRLDLKNVKFVVQYIVSGMEFINFNVIGTELELNAIATLQNINYITAHKDNWTDEWIFQFTLPLIDEGYGVDYFDIDDELFRYYRFSVIYNLEDIDVVLMRHGKLVNDNWFTRGLPIQHERNVVLFNYDRATKISKTDLTLLQLGAGEMSFSLHASLMWSPTVYKYVFSLLIPLDEELEYVTAGKHSIRTIDFITVLGNRETDALNVTIWTLLGLLLATEDSDYSDLAVSYMRNPDGNNGICIFNYDSEHYKGYSDDMWRGKEYMSFVYNLTDYTCSIMVKGYVTITVDIDENDPSIRNAYCWIPIISLERSFQIARLDDTRIIATSNIWNDNRGIYEPSTFVIQYYEVQIDDEYELYANIENGLGTDAYYIGQVDYLQDVDSTNIYATISTDLDIVSDILIYRADIYSEGDYDYYEPAEGEEILYNKHINVPFYYENTVLGLIYNCEINFVISPDPAKAILNAGTIDEISVADFCDQVIEDTKEITDDIFAKQLEDFKSYREMEKQNQD